jgi:hypothetical protein
VPAHPVAGRRGGAVRREQEPGTPAEGDLLSSDVQRRGSRDQSGESVEDASLRPLARALLALAEELLKEEASA